ncbi:MAG: transglycosylase SLT domain-containing protein [Silvibacterium sp.]
MRIPSRTQLLRFTRAIVCAVAAIALLPSANLHPAGVLAAQTETTHHKTAHKPARKAGHKTSGKSKPKSKTRPRATSGTRSRTTRGRLTGRHVSSATRRRIALRSRHHRRRHHLTAREIARSRKLQRAFIASSQLRPMAQQLATLRTPAAYAGVTTYAHNHSGEAASAAYLALGHAYLLDHKYVDAVAEFKNADREGTALDDYASYLTAQAYLQGNTLPQAEPILATFIQKYPDSVFVPQIPVLEANLFIQEGNPQAALSALNPHKAEPIANRADFQLALAKANRMAGNAALAQQLFTRVYLGYPLSGEATEARAQLAASGAIDSMPVSQRRRRADALFAAHHYADAEQEYRSLAASPSLTDGAHNDMLVAAAACQWKLHTLGKAELDSLPDTSDEAGARRLYLLMELARDKDDTATQQSIVTQMESRFPTSPWLAEALYSSGNMYLLRKDYPNAVRYYIDLSTRFPKSCESPHSGPCSNFSPSAHWRAAWLTYRLGNYAQAASMIDDQITEYAGGQEIPAALYWRARLYDGQEHNPAMAVKYYRTLARVYRHYYYANLAEQRLAQMGFAVGDAPTGSAQLDALQPEEVPELSDDVPDQDPHLVKARLLANAGLNEYISPEIQAADGSDEWGGFAEAQIYASYGETWRAMRIMKRAVPYYTSAPIDALPLAYWRILFPQQYWPIIKQNAALNGLDPYMVASLIRQESEFNPGAISYANAYGLMQVLPRVGKDLAKKAGIRHFEDRDLLDPATNIRLGCIYLRQTLDKFGDRPEYAFAAYNAGDSRVLDWQAAGQFHDMDVFVESIPFTQTRDYVQAILRNESIYRELDKAQTQQPTSATEAKSR